MTLYAPVGNAIRIQELIHAFHDRSLLSELSRCVWESLRMFLRETVPQRGAVPGAVIAIQTFGDFLGFHPH
jgi:hypothetical protein